MQPERKNEETDPLRSTINNYVSIIREMNTEYKYLMSEYHKDHNTNILIEATTIKEWLDKLLAI